MKVMQVSARHLERSRDKYNPEIIKEGAHVAAALSLRVLPVAELVIRLHEAVSRTEPDYVVTTGGGDAYDPLFGEYSEPRHGGWRRVGRIPMTLWKPRLFLARPVGRRRHSPGRDAVVGPRGAGPHRLRVAQRNYLARRTLQLRRDQGRSGFLVAVAALAGPRIPGWSRRTWSR